MLGLVSDDSALGVELAAPDDGEDGLLVMLGVVIPAKAGRAVKVPVITTPAKLMTRLAV